MKIVCDEVDGKLDGKSYGEEYLKNTEHGGGCCVGGGERTLKLGLKHIRDEAQKYEASEKSLKSRAFVKLS